MTDADIRVGAEIRMRTLLYSDLTNAVDIIYTWRKPKLSDPEVTEDVEHVCSVEDVLGGIIYYDTTSEDLDIRGEYMQHVFVTYSDGNTVPSGLSFFQVKDLWEQ